MRKVLLLICLASLSVSVFLLQDYFFYKERVYKASKKKFQTITVKTAQELNNLARQVMESAESVAVSLTNGTKTKKNINNALKKALEKNPNFSGGRIAFQPVAYNPKIKLDSASWQRIEGKKDPAVQSVNSDEIDDYFSCWYLTPIHEKKNSWSAPYWDATRNARLITYSALFYRQISGGTEKEAAGVVAIDLSLEDLKDIIHKNVESSGKGFGGLTTGDGKYLYHPRKEYVVSGKTLLELTEEKNDSNRTILNEKAKLGQRAILNHTSTTTGEESWLIAEPVLSSGWSVQNTFIKDDVPINTNILRNRLITAILCGVVFLMSVLLFMLTVMPLFRLPT